MEIERDIRERPIASALPTERARSLYARIIERTGMGVDLDALMEERAARLDAAARESEQR